MVYTYISKYEIAAVHLRRFCTFFCQLRNTANLFVTKAA